MKMTGTVRVNCCIVLAAGVPVARITSGADRSNCAPADRIQSASPKPHWKSISTLPPIVHQRPIIRKDRNARPFEPQLLRSTEGFALRGLLGEKDVQFRHSVHKHGCAPVAEPQHECR